jgi:hypothetical protein
VTNSRLSPEEMTMTPPNLPDWRSAWHDIAQLSSGIEPADARLPLVKQSLAKCEQAYASMDWMAFQEARTGVATAMGIDQEVA